jgi:hypothetical protein
MQAFRRPSKVTFFRDRNEITEMAELGSLVHLAPAWIVCGRNIGGPQVVH